MTVLLEATERVAYQVGFEAARTTEIAKLAGVGIGTLYRYFPSKEALLKGLVEHRWAEGMRWLGTRMSNLKPGPYDAVVEEVVGLTFEMLANQLEAFGKMRVETDQLVHLGPDLIANAAQLVRGALERRREDLATDDVEVASILMVRTVVFLARVGVRDYGDLVQSGRYGRELAKMISRYLAKPST